jgi:hypothetical protein
MMSIMVTILVGFFIFVLGQAFLKLVIEPAQELKKSLGLVSSTLLYNQAKITNAKTCNEISEAIRFCSADIISKSYVVLGYEIIQPVFRLPSKSNIELAAEELNSISYGMRDFGSYARTAGITDKTTDQGIHHSRSINKICKLLNIKTSYGYQKK